MARQIYLLVYRSHPFPAHWALWIPRVEDSGRGKIINVKGTSMAGFELESERGYKLEDNRGSYLVLSVGEVDDRYVVDGTDDAGNDDLVARDILEEKALLVPAPTKSLRPAWGKSVHAAKPRMELKNSQSWMIEYVAKLVEDGIVSREALEVVTGAPKN